MRFSTAATVALAAGPAVVSAAKGTMGFALGMKMPNEKCKSQSDYEADFDAIKAASGATIVRGYAASQCDNMAKSILPAAEKKGFKVVLGIWPDVEDSFNADLEAIVDVADKYKETIYAVTVGSETLYRGDFTGPELKKKIDTVREKLPKGIKIGTADSWNKFYDGTANAILPSVEMRMRRLCTSMICTRRLRTWRSRSVARTRSRSGTVRRGGLLLVRFSTSLACVGHRRTIHTYTHTNTLQTAPTTAMPRAASRTPRPSTRTASARSSTGATTLSSLRPSTSPGSPMPLVTTARLPARRPGAL
jgi:hypothetical protein